MATECFRALQGIAMRVTRLDACGTPVIGAKSTVVSESFVTFGAAAEIEDPDEFTVKTANGRLCLSETGCPTLKRMNISFEVCRADPEMFEIAGGTTLVLDAEDNAVGYRVNSELGDCPRFALEIWSRVPIDDCASEGGSQQWVYFLFPFVTNGRLGDVTIENGPVTFVLTAESQPNPNWGAGPYNVVDTGAENESQTVTITGVPDGGTFTLTFDGQTTAAIDFDATAAEVVTALNALSNIAPGDVVGGGGPLPGTPVTIAFAAALADEDVPQMTADDALLTGGTDPAVAITTTAAGGGAGPLLEEMGSTDHYHVQLTTVAPPTESCGATALAALV
jgi:hypothetical protein